MKALLKALPLALFVACSSAAPEYDKGYQTNESFTISGDWTTQGDPKSYAAGLAILVEVDSSDPSLEGWVEAELGRVNRFETYIVHNNGATQLASDLARMGKVDAPLKVVPTDLGLALSLVLEQTRARKQGGTIERPNDVEAFHIDMSWTMSSKVNERWVEYASGTLYGVSEYEVVTGTQGQYVGGWLETTDSIASAFKEAAMGPLRDIVSDLGIRHPVVAEVISMTETRLAINKGSYDGLSGEENFILCLQDDGINIPIMKGISESAMTESTTLSIVKFNTYDNDAAQYIKSFKEDPKSWVNQHRAKLFVVSVGLGLPKEWANVESQTVGRIR